MGRWVARTGMWVCLCAVDLLTGGAAAAAEPGGFVLSVQGRWLAQGSTTPLVVGSAVAPGSVLVAPAPAALDEIVVIAARTGGVLVSRRCTAVADCRKPLPVPRAAKGSDDAVSDLLARVVERFVREPDRYVATLSRGASELTDVVLTWDEAGVDFAPILKGLPPARYGVSLWPLDCGTDRACRDAPPGLRLAWPLEKAEDAVLAGLRPGLYELTLSRAKGSGTDAAAVLGGTGSQARCWVLVVKAAEKAAADAAYREASAWAAGWGTQVDLPVKQGFVRAALEVQARP